MDSLARYIAVHKALADASRVRALGLLTQGELCLCELIQVLDLAPSTVSRHMSDLHRAGLVARRKEGRWQFYRLPGRKAAPDVREALRSVRRLLETDAVLRADLARLAEVKRMDRDEVSACYESPARRASMR
jgi:DNA-binding transcriptional ArsR family regulator